MKAKASSESNIPSFNNQKLKETRWGSFSVVDNVQETHKLMRDIDESGNKKVNQYILLQELGRGVHGKVKLCRDSTDGTLWALKIVEKKPKKGFPNKLSKAYREYDGREYLMKIHREIAILKKCRHSNIVALKEVIDDPDCEKIYIVLEYMEGGELECLCDDVRKIVLISPGTFI